MASPVSPAIGQKAVKQVVGVPIGSPISPDARHGPCPEELKTQLDCKMLNSFLSAEEQMVGIGWFSRVKANMVTSLKYYCTNTDQRLTVRETTSSHKNTEGMSYRPSLLGTVGWCGSSGWVADCMCGHAVIQVESIHALSRKTEGSSTAKRHSMATCVDYLLPINGRYNS